MGVLCVAGWSQVAETGWLLASTWPHDLKQLVYLL